MKQFYYSVQRMSFLSPGGLVVQDTHAHTDGWTDGQYAILSLAQLTEPLSDNYRPECPEVSDLCCFFLMHIKHPEGSPSVKSNYLKNEGQDSYMGCPRLFSKNHDFYIFITLGYYIAIEHFYTSE